jgi:hypothetical protein
MAGALLAVANSGQVALLTPGSVAWADSSTVINSSKGDDYLTRWLGVGWRPVVGQKSADVYQRSWVLRGYRGVRLVLGRDCSIAQTLHKGEQQARDQEGSWRQQG